MPLPAAATTTHEHSSASPYLPALLLLAPPPTPRPMSAADLIESFKGQNNAPRVFASGGRRREDVCDDGAADAIDAVEVFDLIRDISDPEHPLSLEQLNIVQVVVMGLGFCY